MLGDTIEIHFLELSCYNLTEEDLPAASIKDRWIYWLLNAHRYDFDRLMELFPEVAIQTATRELQKIADRTEDKEMYKHVKRQDAIISDSRYCAL